MERRRIKANNICFQKPLTQVLDIEYFLEKYKSTHEKAHHLIYQGFRMRNEAEKDRPFGTIFKQTKFSFMKMKMNRRNKNYDVL